MMRVKRIEAANAKGFENFAVECEMRKSPPPVPNSRH